MKKKRLIKGIALCLCMALLFTCLPGSTFAASDNSEGSGTTQEIVLSDQTGIQQEETGQTASVQGEIEQTNLTSETAQGEAQQTNLTAEAAQGDEQTSETVQNKNQQASQTEAGQSETAQTAQNDTQDASQAVDQAADSTDSGISDQTSAAETQAKPVFKSKMKFATLETYANSPEVQEETTVSVKIDEDGKLSDGTIRVGKINEETVEAKAGMKFEGAFVVTYTTDGSGNQTVANEDEIKYIGSYTSSDGTEHIYYAFSETPNTGILLNSNQYIKLVYRTVCKVNYEVRLNSVDGSLLGDGSLAEDGTAKAGTGGGFVSAADELDKGASLNLQFKEEKSAKNAATDPAARDYELVGIYQVAADGTQTEVSVDKDNVGKIDNMSGDVKIVAVVRTVEQYKLTETHSRGHICWAGHGDEKNSNTTDPYSVDASLFCSYDSDGSVTGTKGATVVADPGGTIYFVMYSQKGDKWQLQHMIINGVYIDTTCDGNVHDTDLGDGMTAHFQYLGDEKKDSHLKDNASAERNKFACWVTDVSSDISVDFECESDERETLTLVQADGIAQVVASSFDRYNRADYYKGIYNGGKNVTFHLNSLKFPNRTLTSNDIGKDLVNEHWSGNKSGALTSDDNHSSVEYKHSSSGYGNRYVYFKTKTGYDPNTTVAKITGQEGTLKVESIANAMSKPTSHFFGLIKGDRNRAAAVAKQEGYDWFVYYEGVGRYFRQLSLSCSPYTYSVVYDLNGGTLNGASTYTDSKTDYSIEEGSNTIILPGTTPVKEGCIFQGWELIPTNGKYAEDSSFSNPVYDEAGKFVINSTTYEYGLQTEKTTYEPDGTSYTDWNAVSGGAHKFTFKAIWAAEDDPSSAKANYSISSYQEITKAMYDSISDAGQKKENNGKYYQLMGTVENHVGTKGETIIGIPAEPAEGYLLSDASITRLENFKSDGNTATELIYYYNVSHTLTVSKVLTGDYADKTKGFAVTITLKDANGAAVNGSFDYVDENGQTGTITFVDGTAAVTLKGGQSVSIPGLETGTYSVSEAGDENYTVTYAIDDGSAATAAPTDQALNLSFAEDGTIANALTTVTIKNQRNDAVPAGVNDGYPTWWMFAAAGAVLAGILFYEKTVNVRRRGSRRGGDME